MSRLGKEVQLIQSDSDIVKLSVALETFTLSKHLYYMYTLKVLCGKKSVLIEKVIYHIEDNLLYRSSTVYPVMGFLLRNTL